MVAALTPRAKRVTDVQSHLDSRNKGNGGRDHLEDTSRCYHLQLVLSS